MAYSRQGLWTKSITIGLIVSLWMSVIQYLPGIYGRPYPVDAAALDDAYSLKPQSSPARQPPTCNFSPTTAAEFIAAVVAANGNGQADTICLVPNASYTFTARYSNIYSALPKITSEITIEGHNAILTRAAGAPTFRFLETTATGHLTLNDLTFTQGVDAAGGGGAVNNKGGTVAINRCTFTENQAGTGGAVDNTTGSMTISDSLFANNTGSYGGAVDNDAGGTMIISGSTFSSNNVSVKGGAIHNDGGVMTIVDSVFSQNTAVTDGGVIANDSPLTIQGSTFINNAANASGGAISNDATLIIEAHSTTGAPTVFEGNEAADWGGAIYNSSDGDAEINQSHFSSNTADSGGGAIRNHGAVTLTGITFENNSTPDSGGAIYVTGSIPLLNISDAEFSANSAGIYGGALYVWTAPGLADTDCVTGV